MYDKHNQSHDADERLVIQTMRLLENIAGIVGFEYIRGCFGQNI